MQNSTDATELQASSIDEALEMIRSQVESMTSGDTAHTTIVFRGSKPKASAADDSELPPLEPISATEDGPTIESGEPKPKAKRTRKTRTEVIDEAFKRLGNKSKSNSRTALLFTKVKEEMAKSESSDVPRGDQELADVKAVYQASTSRGHEMWRPPVLRVSHCGQVCGLYKQDVSNSS